MHRKNVGGSRDTRLGGACRAQPPRVVLQLLSGGGLRQAKLVVRAIAGAVAQQDVVVLRTAGLNTISRGPRLLAMRAHAAFHVVKVLPRTSPHERGCASSIAAGHINRLNRLKSSSCCRVRSSHILRHADERDPCPVSQ